MLSKFSVKKPYTVLVGVVMVLVLGFVSFTGMTADLLPSINLPYAIVMTTYVGASPEEVEEAVTKPIESSMATISNIQNVSSISSENYSVVILEFAETTNMDSVTLEMRESLDQLKAYWSDSVGSPIIMKLNPDMLPIMVASVDVDGMDSIALTRLVEDDLSQEVESIEGVASVSTSGGVTEDIQVILRQEKIDKVNEEIRAALDGKFADAEQELEDGEKELSSGRRKIESGKTELENSKNDTFNQISEGQLEIEKKEKELLAAEDQLAANEALLKDKETSIAVTEATVKAQKQALEQMKAGLAEVESNLNKINESQSEESVTKALTYVKTTLAANLSAVPGYELMSMTQILGVMTTAGLDTTELAQMVELYGIADILVGNLDDADTIAAAQASIKARMEDTKATLIATQTNLTSTITQTEAEITMNEMMVSETRKAIDSARPALEEARAALEEGKTALLQAKVELSKNQSLASVELAAAKAQLDAALTQITSGESQMEAAREQLESAKEQAYEGASMENILTSDMIKNILSAQNFSMPAGYVTEDNVDYLVRVGDKIPDDTALKDMILLDPSTMGIEGVKPIRLSDVADVLIADNSSEIYAKVNGNPGIIMTMEKQTGYSTGEVSDKLKNRFEGLEAEYEGLHVTVLMDQGVYIDLVVDSVLNNMISGGLLAVLILLFFLKDLKPTVIIACSIPISILTAIVLMYFSGVTLNIISLSGLALGVGMLVDNSIVVIENIYRLRNLGYSRREAAIRGAGEVGGAIIASTLTTVSVFAPIVFTTGITRQLFVDMGLTIAYSLLASLIVALTLVPAMASSMLNREKEQKAGIFTRLQNGYGRLIGVALKHKAIVLLSAVALLILSVAAAYSNGTGLFPDMESTQTTITLTMEGEPTVEELGAMSDEVISRLNEIEDIETIGAMTGSGGMMSGALGGSGGGDSVTMYLILSENRTLSNAELKKQIQDRTSDLNCELEVDTAGMDMSALGGSGISVRIKGKDLDKLQEIARELAARIEAVEGTANVLNGMEESTGELRIVVDKAAASSYGLTVAQVFQQVAAAISSSTKATTISTDVAEYEVVIKDEEAESFTRDDIRSMNIEVTNSAGEKEEVPLSELVTFIDTAAPLSVSRDAQSRYITVSAGIAEGYNVGLVGNDVQMVLDEYELPEGYTMEATGEDASINEAMGELMKMLLLAVVFIYLIMVAQFQSLLSPFIIMFTIPLAFTGGFLALFIGGMEISVIAMVGFVMLSGIIVNNGIVLVDYTNQLREQGMEKRAALMEAGRTRLRPIIMTALTTILGLSTMAAGMGMGSDMVQPMAVVTIGGLIYGTLLTLFVVPCIYDILNRKSYQKKETE